MWSNWSGGLEARPRAIVRPMDEAGVISAVRRGAERGLRVRAIGSGYSFAPLALTDGVAVDLSALTGLVAIGSERVRVRAGTTLGVLHRELAEHDRELAVAAELDAPTVAGAISTGSHGGGAQLGSLSALVTGARLVDGSGTVREVPPTDLDAVRTALGALGVITEVDLTLQPAYPLRVHRATRSLDEALSDGYLDGHRIAEFAVYPYAEKVVARWADPVGAAAEPISAMRGAGVRTAARTTATGAAVTLGRIMPRLVPTLNRAATWAVHDASITDLGYRALAVRAPVRFEQTEWALPRTALASGLRALLAAVRSRELEVGLPIQVRVGAAESGWLHPAFQRPTGWVAVRAVGGGDPRPLLRMAAEVLAAYGGRPHWAGRHEWTLADVAAHYPRLPDFQRVRDAYDPNRLFTNPHVEELLGG